MKILALSHSCVTDVNQQLFAALHRMPGVEVALIIPANWRSEYTGRPQTPSLLPGLEFSVHQSPVVMAGHVSLHFYKHLPHRALAAFGPDILLSTQEPWSLSHRQAGKLAEALHVPIVFQTNQNLLKRYPLPFRDLEQRAYRQAAAALAFSEEARQVMLAKGLTKPSYVVPYGIDLTLFGPGHSSKLRQALGLGQSLVIGYLGRFVAAKGLDTLITAAARLRRERPETDIKLLLVGTGPESATLRAQIDAAGLTDRCVFPGVIPHTQAGEYLRCMDLFVLPSRTTAAWKEQFGRVIIEAMACEVPVIGSDSGQIPSLIAETGGGIVFREGDAGGLAQALRQLSDDPAERRRLGQQGRRVVCSRYTFEAVAAQMHGIFGEVLAGQTTAARGQKD